MSAFGAPALCLLAPVIISLAGLVWYRAFVRLRLAKKLDRTGKFLRHFSPLREITKALLLSVGIVCLWFALLHPRWGYEQQTITRSGRDVLVALDISRSMLARDVEPNRLSVAKQAIKQVLLALPSQRVGLIVFGDQARVYCPLTHDRELCAAFVDQLDQSMMSDGMTYLDAPLATALAVYRRGRQDARQLLLLVTDGEDVSGNVAAIQAQAVAQGLIVLVIGVGTRQGAPVPLYDDKGNATGFVKNEKGAVVLSRLNESVLRSLAQATGGKALFCSGGVFDVREIIQAIEQCENAQIEQEKRGFLREQYAWFLLVSFVCLLAEWVL